MSDHFSLRCPPTLWSESRKFPKALIAIHHAHFTFGMYRANLFFSPGLNCFPRYVDLHRAYSVLLANFYKTLYNINMRRRAEQAEPGVRAILEKTERSDVSQDESLLTRMERDTLREWERKRERLTVLEMRVDEAVFIIRDFGALTEDER